MIGAVQHGQSLASTFLSMVATAGLPFVLVGLVIWRDRRGRFIR